MKVLFINTNDTSGGAARAAVRVMRGVQQCGIEAQMFVKEKNSNASDVIDLYHFVPKNLLYRVCDWAATKLKNKWQHHKWHPYKNTKQNVYMSDLRSTRIHDVLQKIDYDIVHLHWINNRFIDIRELTKIHKPIVWTLHDSWPFTSICHLPYGCKQYEKHCGQCPMLGSRQKRDLAYEVFQQKLDVYKKLDLHIVAPSRWLAECAKHSVLLGQYSVNVIPNCIDTELFKPIDKNNARVQWGLDTTKRYMLFGAMQATTDLNKGFDLLVQALKYLPYKDVELIVYGTNENLSEIGIPLPIHTMGYINRDEQMAFLYNAADVMIVPSRSENLSNTIMESLSCSTPVVAFNIGGNSDMIDHKQNGYLAKEYDCEDLARGIDWCLRHNEENTLSAHAREKVMNNYTTDIVAEQYKKLYDSL